MFEFLFDKTYENGMMNDKEIILKEIEDFKKSRTLMDMITGEEYYAGNHDILKRKREVIGVNGDLVEVTNLPNNKIVDNQYKKMVNQKNNYLLGKPLTIQTESEDYAKLVKKIFNRKFQRTLKAVGEDSLNCGLAWLYVYYDEGGNLSFKRIKSHELIPGWADADHTQLDYAIRLYKVKAYEGTIEKEVEKVEVYDGNGVSYFELDGGKLISCDPYHVPYFSMGDFSYNWSKIPLIPFKFNAKEIPLIKNVKSLQDGLNLIESNFQNSMEEDARNTILVLVNYDGENLGEFRRNLAQYGAVKVRSDGDLRTLQVEVNSENYKAILEIFKKAIIENAMGYDAKDDRLAGNPNQMNIQSMYSDIDLDANSMETEYQASFEELLYFINSHLHNTGKGDFFDEEINIIFNRDMLISETEIIENCQRSVGILSDETILAMHPWVDDVHGEIERIKNQRDLDFEKAFGDEG